MNCNTGCKLFGAYRVAVSIKDAAILIHSMVGCNWGTLLFHLPVQPGDIRQASTVMYEQDLTFGGDGLLKEALVDMLQLYDSAVFFVLGGCAPAIIGDDIENVVASIDSDKPIFSLSAAGFLGDAHNGALDMLYTIIENLPSRPVIPRSVNLIGLYSDDFMVDNDLSDICKLLKHHFINVNAVLPYDTYDRIQNTAGASLNIVFEGFEPVGERLKNRFGTPFITVHYPYGIEGCRTFSQEICRKLQVAQNRKEMPAEKHSLKILERLQPSLSRYRDMPVAITGDSVRLPGLAAMLEKELALSVDVCLKTMISGASISEIVEESAAVILFGSSFERGIAEQLKIPLIRFTYPVYDRISIIRCGYAGFDGMIHIVEDFLNALLVAEL